MKGLRRCAAWSSVVVVLLGIMAPARPLHAQNICYAYDDVGRLMAFVEQQGNVATYGYDGVGNLTTIGRVNAPAGPVGITLVVPSTGKVGTPVQIFGKGFSSNPTGNTVSFNGTLATVTSASSNCLTATVPSGATTGVISVTVGPNTAMSPNPFTVSGVLVVSPTSTSVWTSGTAQFTATEGGTPTSQVDWSVNGITGGDPTTFGTISTAGLYTAPASMSPDLESPTLTITATKQGDRASSASATVGLLAATAGTAGGKVSLGFAESRLTDKSVVASVSLGFAPVVTLVSPASASPSTFTLTLNGRGFTGATAVEFWSRSPSVVFDNDTAIGATGLSVNADGTQLTATVTIGPSARTGTHVVRVRVGTATSMATGTANNLFTVN